MRGSTAAIAVFDGVGRGCNSNPKPSGGSDEVQCRDWHHQQDGSVGADFKMVGGRISQKTWRQWGGLVAVGSQQIS